MHTNYVTALQVPSLTNFAIILHLPAFSEAWLLSPLTLSTIAGIFDGQAMSFTRAPRKLLDCWAEITPPLRCLQSNWSWFLKKALMRNDLPSAIITWREIAAERNYLRAISGSKGPCAKQNTASSRHDIRAELRHDIVPL